MSHGLLWLPLLAMFIALARLGWVEYRKLEVYRQWAQGFEYSKYDILAVLGLRGDRLVWGRPTRAGIVNISTCSLADIIAIEVEVGGQPMATDQAPGRIELVLHRQGTDPDRIPFTELPLACQWRDRLRQNCKGLQVQ